MPDDLKVWFLLYDGSSEDGMGRGEYCGRTTSYLEAKAHHDKHYGNPYSTASVTAITDKAEHRLHCQWDWDQWARKNGMK